VKTPKILPWLARKHGVSEARATKLWADSVRYATDKTGWVGTSDYWKAAMDRLIELLEAEAGRSCQPPLSTLVRIQTRLGILPLIAWHGVLLVGSASWSRLTAPQPPARPPRRRPRPLSRTPCTSGV
jgi:hypothetical protein